jgi:hypothetical protein
MAEQRPLKECSCKEVLGGRYEQRPLKECSCKEVLGGRYGRCCLCVCREMYFRFLYIFTLFNFSQCSTPFELHDDNYVLKEIKFSDRLE